MKGIKQSLKRPALLGLILLILLTAGSVSSCKTNGDGGKQQKGEGLSCTLTIRCETALQNHKLSKGKRKVLPEDGVILSREKVEFQEGDTVYDILKKVTKEKRIQMESAESPLYESQYVEGIANLYELDCGDLSGWMYKVNDTFPRTGCSKYAVGQGDDVQWIYSCQLGKDIGGGNFQ